MFENTHKYVITAIRIGGGGQRIPLNIPHSNSLTRTREGTRHSRGGNSSGINGTPREMDAEFAKQKNVSNFSLYEASARFSDNDRKIVTAPQIGLNADLNATVRDERNGTDNNKHWTANVKKKMERRGRRRKTKKKKSIPEGKEHLQIVIEICTQSTEYE